MIEQITVFALFLTTLLLLGINLLVLRQYQKKQKNLETFKMWVAKKAGENVEQRCQHCTAGPECPGYNTGVIYPCEHYKELEG